MVIDIVRVFTFSVCEATNESKSSFYVIYAFIYLCYGIGELGSNTQPDLNEQTD